MQCLQAAEMVEHSRLDPLEVSERHIEHQKVMKLCQHVLSEVDNTHFSDG